MDRPPESLLTAVSKFYETASEEARLHFEIYCDCERRHAPTTKRRGRPPGPRRPNDGESGSLELKP
jgi:hypothetical protein